MRRNLARDCTVNELRATVAELEAQAIRCEDRAADAVVLSRLLAAKCRYLEAELLRRSETGPERFREPPGTDGTTD